MSNLDNLNSSEHKNKSKSNIDITSKFISDFTKYSIGKYKNQYIDKVMKSESISEGSDIDKRIKNFETSDNQYSSLDRNKITIEKLKSSIGREYSKISNARSNYLEHTFGQYKLDDKQKAIIEKNIKNKSENDLNNLISSSVDNKNFLNKTFGKNKIIEWNSFELLSKISDKDIQSNFVKLSIEDQQEILSIADNFRSGKFLDQDIKDLFSLDLLDLDQKKEIISTYIPYINLQDSVDLGLITNKKAEKYKEKILKQILKNKGVGSKKSIIESCTLNDFKIKSSDLFSNNESLNNIAKGVGFSHVENDFKKFKQEAEKDAILNGPQSLKGIINIFSSDKNISKFKNLRNFYNGNVIKITTKDKEGNIISAYSRISSIDEDNNKIFLVDIGEGDSSGESINLSKNGNGKAYHFKDFVNILLGDNIESIFYSDSELQKIIENPDSTLTSKELDIVTSGELKSDPIKFDNKNKSYLSNLKDKKLELESNINDLEVYISSLKSSITGTNKNEINYKISDLEKEISIFKKDLDQVNNEISDSNSGKLSFDSLAKLINEIDVLKKLDSLDRDGKKFGLNKGDYIESSAGIHEIYKSIDWENCQISLKGIGIPVQTIDLSSFCDSFEKNKAKRIGSISNLDELIRINSNKSEQKDEWSKYEVKDGKIHIKEIDKNSKVRDTQVEYLTSKKSNKVYKIENVDGGMVKFRYGERKEINSLSDTEKSKYKDNIKLGKDGKPEEKDGKIQYHGEQLNLNKDIESLSLTAFNKIINGEKESFAPEWQTGKYKTNYNSQNIQNDFYGSRTTRIFKRISLSEFISGGNLMVDNIKDYVAKGNSIHSAKIALLMGKVLPTEIQQELLVKVERAENESMEKEIESLSKVDSKIATERIKKWLLNKDTAEYKKEAGMLFVISKYGTLTGKACLHQFKGKFLRYEAFGGRVGDEHFMEVKEKAEKSGQSFSEENLVFMLLKKQCKISGYNGIKRRSRLHKEFEGKWGNGVKEEEQKGYEDAAGKRTAKDMIKGGNDELFTGTLPNAIGWYRKAMERGAELEGMAEGFFLMLFSGALYNTDQKVYTKYIKSIWDGHGMPQILARMSSNTDDMKLMNKVIVSLSYKIESKKPGLYTGMSKEAERLYNKAINNQGTELERLKECKSFWDKYGKVLSRSINMISSDLDSSNDLKYADTDKIILEEKYTDVSLIKDSKEAEHTTNLQKYFSMLQSYTIGSFKKDFMEDAFGESGIGGLNVFENTKKYLLMNNGGGLREEKAGNIFWERFTSDINRLKDKKVIEYLLSQLFAGFLSNHGQSIPALRSYNYSTSNIGKILNSWGINIQKDLGSYSPQDVLKGQASNIISNIANNILSGKNLSGNSEVGNKVLESMIKDATNDILENPVNDNNQMGKDFSNIA